METQGAREEILPLDTWEVHWRMQSVKKSRDETLLKAATTKLFKSESRRRTRHTEFVNDLHQVCARVRLGVGAAACTLAAAAAAAAVADAWHTFVAFASNAALVCVAHQRARERKTSSTRRRASSPHWTANGW